MFKRNMLENGGRIRYTSHYHANICIFSCSLVYNIGGKNVTAKGATWLKLKDLKPLPTTSTTTEITTTNEEGPETEGNFEVEQDHLPDRGQNFH